MKTLAKLTVTLLFAMFLLIGVNSSAHAELPTGWHYCNVEEVGSGKNICYLKIGGIYYPLDPGDSKSQMATALTAVSLGKKVNIYINDSKIVYVFTSNVNMD
ncbi:hypothetical protein ACFL0H_06105 [Thermodesulfobacteriota bacterium]